MCKKVLSTGSIYYQCDYKVYNSRYKAGTDRHPLFKIKQMFTCKWNVIHSEIFRPLFFFHFSLDSRQHSWWIYSIIINKWRTTDTGWLGKQLINSLRVNIHPTQQHQNNSRPARPFCNATAPSAGVHLLSNWVSECLSFIGSYSKSSWSSKLKTPRSGSWRFHGTYLEKKKETKEIFGVCF